MRKVVIFGNSGSGKSTLARHVSETDNLPHFDLDSIAWLRSDPPERAPIEQSRETMEAFFSDNDGWVIEGCYGDLIEIAVPIANELIFLNPDVTVCVENAKSRPWEPHKYASKEEQDRNLDMLIDWIRAYTERTDELSLSAHQSIYDAFQGKKTMLTENVKLG